MRFLHPDFLWLLFILLPLAFLFSQKKAVPALRFSTIGIARDIAKKQKGNLGKASLFLRLIGITLLIFALARPQYGESTTEIKASGIDILLAVDTSGSMGAMDFHLDNKAANRLAVVKKVVRDFIEKRPNDRIGLLAFSGLPYLVSPLTLDHEWLLERLDVLTTKTIKEDGTAIGSAIGTAVNRLRERQAKSKIVILLTDGVNNAGKVPPLIAAEAAEALKIKVYTIGVGSKGDAPFPVEDSFGRKRLIYQKVDIDEATLQAVAKKTGALYFRATDTASLEKIYSEINTMERTTHKISRFENYTELFPFFLLFFFIVSGIELVLAIRRIP